jgi:hypothetical protein
MGDKNDFRKKHKPRYLQWFYLHWAFVVSPYIFIHEESLCPSSVFLTGRRPGGCGTPLGVMPHRRDRRVQQAPNG